MTESLLSSTTRSLQELQTQVVYLYFQLSDRVLDYTQWYPAIAICRSMMIYVGVKVGGIGSKEDFRTLAAIYSVLETYQTVLKNGDTLPNFDFLRIVRKTNSLCQKYEDLRREEWEEQHLQEQSSKTELQQP